MKTSAKLIASSAFALFLLVNPALFVSGCVAADDGMVCGPAPTSEFEASEVVQGYAGTDHVYAGMIEDGEVTLVVRVDTLSQPSAETTWRMPSLVPEAYALAQPCHQRIERLDASGVFSVTVTDAAGEAMTLVDEAPFQGIFSVVGIGEEVNRLELDAEGDLGDGVSSAFRLIAPQGDTAALELRALDYVDAQTTIAFP